MKNKARRPPRGRRCRRLLRRLLDKKTTTAEYNLALFLEKDGVLKITSPSSNSVSVELTEKGIETAKQIKDELNNTTTINKLKRYTVTQPRGRSLRSLSRKRK